MSYRSKMNGLDDPLVGFMTGLVFGHMAAKSGNKRGIWHGTKVVLVHEWNLGKIMVHTLQTCHLRFTRL